MKNSETSSKSKPESSRDGLPVDLGPWMNSSKQAMENWGQFTTKMLKSSSDFYQEIAAFSQSRLQADAEFIKSMFACRTPGDCLKVQRQFFDEATKQYLTESQKLQREGSSLLTHSMAAFTSASPPAI